MRLYFVNVNGATVTILVEAAAADFAAFSTEAEAVLASVNWA